MFNVPILFIIHNRPDTTELVFNEIRKIKPKFLFLSADGAKEEHDVPLCEQTRKIVLENIDWDCELKTLLREKNLGCKKAVSSAINWFFEQVEEGIILEDDCLPEQSFFPYCKELLEKYRNNPKIFTISGCNFNYSPNNNYSYGFTRFFGVWGWASWRRSAQLIDYQLIDWKKTHCKNYFLYSRLRNSLFDLDIKWIENWYHNFDSIANETLNAWSYSWVFKQILLKRYSIFPSVNLVKNIGFDRRATHTTDFKHPAANMNLEHLEFPLKSPICIATDVDFEEKFVKKIACYNRQSLLFIIKSHLIKFGIVLFFNSIRHRIISFIHR